MPDDSALEQVEPEESVARDWAARDWAALGSMAQAPAVAPSLADPVSHLGGRDERLGEPRSWVFQESGTGAQAPAPIHLNTCPARMGSRAGFLPEL